MDVRALLPGEGFRLRWSVRQMMVLVAIVAVVLGYEGARAQRRAQRRRASQQQYLAAWDRSQARNSVELAKYTQREIENLRIDLDTLPTAKADAVRRSIADRERLIVELRAQAAGFRRKAKLRHDEARKVLAE
jgi:hypothetical protein